MDDNLRLARTIPHKTLAREVARALRLGVTPSAVKSRELEKSIEASFEMEHAPPHLRSLVEDVVVRLATHLDPEFPARLWNALDGDTQLPLLQAVPKTRGDLDFTGCVLVGVQHLFGSTVKLMDALNERGLAYEDMYVTGKLYSTNALSVEMLRRRGVQVLDPIECYAREGHMRFPGNREFLSELSKRLLEKALCARHRRCERLLLLDEGGTLVENASRSRLGTQAAAVEQTRSGSWAVDRIDGLRIPVVNVAGARLKLAWESPLIGFSVYENIIQRMESLGLDQGSKTVRIVGFGNVGSMVASAFQRDSWTVEVNDAQAVARERARKCGYAVVEKGDQSTNATVVVGCTGGRWFDLASARRSRCTVFASASSTDIEFGHVIGSPDFEIERGSLEHLRRESSFFERCHSDYRIRGTDQVFVLNGGFPVNFTGGIDDISPEWIQITRALLLAGLLQARTTNDRVGSLPLFSVLEAEIERAWRGRGHYLARVRDQLEISPRNEG